ncbi:MAG: hypothetical protein U1E59_17255 [Amaricoccus sp.]
MPNLFTRALSHWGDAGRRRAEAERLARLPQYLLRDMGLSLAGPEAIARQIAGAGAGN